MNNRLILSGEETKVLQEVYGYEQPEEILRGEVCREQNELMNILQILREETESNADTFSYSESKNICQLERDVVFEVEREGIEKLDSYEREIYRYYLFRNAYEENRNGKVSQVYHSIIAKLVMLDHRIMVHNQTAYVYNEEFGMYRSDESGLMLKKLIRKELIQIDERVITNRIIEDIYNLIIGDYSINVSDERINSYPSRWMHFKNGYYDPVDDSMHPHNPDYYAVGCIPYDYDPIRYPSRYKAVTKGTGILRETTYEPLFFDEWLNGMIPDEDDQLMVLQYLGYLLTRRTDLQVFLMLVGQGGTGKSTLLRTIEKMIGKENVSNVSLQGLQDRFSPIELYHKQANICADIPLGALSEVDMIKKLTGEDTILAERKFKNPFTFKSYARLLFSANDVPVNLSDRSNAFYRRMLILKMDKKPETVDPRIFEKLEEEIPNILTRAVEEYCCSEFAVIESSNSKEWVKAAHKNSDTVEAFIDDRCEMVEDARVNRSVLYLEYESYCRGEGRKPLSMGRFYKALEDKGFRQIKGKDRYVVGLKLSNIVPLTGTYSNIG